MKHSKHCQGFMENQHDFKNLQALLYLLERCEVPWISLEIKHCIMSHQFEKKYSEIRRGVRDCDCNKYEKPHRAGCRFTQDLY